MVLVNFRLNVKLNCSAKKTFRFILLLRRWANTFVDLGSRGRKGNWCTSLNTPRVKSTLESFSFIINVRSFLAPKQNK